ncbi:MAG: 4-hydroxy-3-methylbut-2-enyl diphosphate reductase [Cryomorphaceae bacterium]|jgi:4-hydroxy-3-methylbut-2-enyl diphosphate reductase
MKVCNEMKFDVVVASHYGMCFGVKAAIATAQKLAARSPVTVLGELAHNATVKQNLEREGAQHSKLEGSGADTKHVIITAHGASDKERKRWADLGHRVTDTTCPLVHKAHAALRNLVAAGYTPIVIGKPGHVEVRGLAGDFPDAQVVLNVEDVRGLNIVSNKIGVISQTTQQIDDVDTVLAALRLRFSGAEVKFIDTVCRPTKERQVALLELCAKVKVVVVVGGMNSNNTAQLAEKCRKLGCVAYHVQTPNEVLAEWFKGVDKVGLTAGTSTPDEDVACVKKKLFEISNR